MNRRFLVAMAGAVLTATTFSSCETPGRGAAVGALTGAGIGGIATGSVGGAAVGAAAGAATGAAIGEANRQYRYRHYNY